MSYIRGGSVYKYVDGISVDYIYPTSYEKGKKTIHYIEDYGKISDECLVELLFRYTKITDALCPDHDLKGYLLNKVAERLNVKLRKKPLTDNQEIKEHWKNLQKFRKTREYKRLEKLFKKGMKWKKNTK